MNRIDYSAGASGLRYFFCEKLMINDAKLLTGEGHMIIMITELSVIRLS